MSQRHIYRKTASHPLRWRVSRKGSASRILEAKSVHTSISFIRQLGNVCRRERRVFWETAGKSKQNSRTSAIMEKINPDRVSVAVTIRRSGQPQTQQFCVSTYGLNGDYWFSLVAIVPWLNAWFSPWPQNYLHVCVIES